MQVVTTRAEACDFEFWYVFGHVLKINDGIKSVKSCIIEQIEQCNCLTKSCSQSGFYLLSSQNMARPHSNMGNINLNVIVNKKKFILIKLRRIGCLIYFYIQLADILICAELMFPDFPIVDWLWWVWLLCANTNFLDRMTQFKSLECL